METRRLLIAFLLSMAVLFVWYRLFPPEPPTPAPPAPMAAATEQGPAPASPERGAEASRPASPSSPSSPGPAEPQERIEAPREERVVLETDEVRAELTNRGAQLVSFILKDRGAGEDDVDLVRARQSGPYPFAVVGRDAAPLPLADALFVPQTGDGGRSVTFRYAGPAGTAVKRFALRDDGLFDVEVTVPGRDDWSVAVGPGVRNPTADELESRFGLRSAVVNAGGEVQRLASQEAAAPTVVPGAGLRWVGLEDTYFLTLITPETPLDQATLLPVLVETGADGARFLPMPNEDALTKAQEDLSREYLLLLDPAGDTLGASAYWGAKEYDRLADLGLEDAVDLGFFGILVKPLLKGLHYIYANVVPNYGWAIVVMTVLIKILLLPLTHKSYVSTRKMQELAPKMNAIRDRYRPKLKDKQGRPNLEAQRKMNEEIMGLYKSEGVNPAGGCVPLLLQMPVFFAFYHLLSVAVELRGAPWILWVADLSAKDPYYVLPIVMGATQFLQMRMTPMAGDPLQRKIFQFMPVAMTGLFLGFPSGLVLYWLTNNVLTIAQQWVYNHLKRKREATGETTTTGDLKKVRRNVAK